MLKEREIIDEPLMTWKKYGGSQWKLVVISKIWPRFWINRGLWICGKLVHPFVHLPKC
jgi:hypothetical protein